MKGQKSISSDKNLLAYIIGLALGDGNLSNPNGRATRLRISCDKKYPLLIARVKRSLETLFPDNKISLIDRKGCIDVTCYSNYLENLFGWKAKGGGKIAQSVSVPKWVMDQQEYSTQCLKGLVETDGSIYYDREYKMVNFVTYIPELADNFLCMVRNLGFSPNVCKFKNNKSKHTKYTIRISKNVNKFLEIIGAEKN